MNNHLSLTWPPPYIIKKHPRSRVVKLRTSIKHGLEITVPFRFNLKHIPAVLEKHKSWIEKHLQQLHLQYQALNILPNEIHFYATKQLFRIHYMTSNTKLKLMLRPDNELVLLGKHNDKEVYKKILIRFIKDQAKQYLLLKLEKIHREIGLPYQKITIRDQQTRWGSCSREKTINLNYKLIFLPENLVRHILIHELCHTIHLNHSKKFWQLVAHFDPNWQAHRILLRKANEYVPGWLL